MIKKIEDVSCAFLHETDLICFSHLRWGFVYQRPQHLLSRFANCTRVFFIEEPVFYESPDSLVIRQESENLFIVVPHLKQTDNGIIEMRLNKLVNTLLTSRNIQRYFFWYYTPMATSFSENFTPEFVVYDCMDELSAFKYAPPELKERERKLLQKADVVFTGGQSIYEAKKNVHHNIHPFPSSIDKQHFGEARVIETDPADQKEIPHPRLGFIGVIDERMDIELIRKVATAKPQWQFVMIGPVVKIDPALLPQLPNIHYLGGKDYKELPQYIAGWDLAIIPFALNESTRFISPTKTPEYLAAGKPVISTPIRDVVKPYGEQNLVHIAATADEFIPYAEQELNTTNKTQWLKQVDEFLSDISWDKTWQQMVEHLEKIAKGKTTKNTVKAKEQLYV